MIRDNSRRRTAVRRAREAREDQIEAALAALFTALAEAERLRGAARQKAEVILADGERSAARHYAAACAAVRALRDLLDSNAAVAELSELRPEDVRDMLAAARAQEPAPAGSGNEATTCPGEDEDPASRG